MVFPDSARFSKKDEVLIQEMGEEAVLLDLEGERYYGLDEVGLRIYHSLATEHSIVETCDLLLQEFEVDPAQLRSDLENLLTNLLKAGLLIRAND
jgi:signal transduction histidine kinase